MSFLQAKGVKRLLLYITLILVPAAVLAQRADSIGFVQGVHMAGEDSAQAVPPDDRAPHDHIKLLQPENLPSAVQKELNGNELFSGWRSRARVEYDKNTDMYWVHFSDSGKVRSYAFNSEGAPVSVREKNDSMDVNQKR